MSSYEMIMRAEMDKRREWQRRKISSHINMEDKMIDKYGNWTKTMYLDTVNGQDIADEQWKINVADKMDVVATTILPSREEGKFHAWIYYKVHTSAVSLPKDEEPKEQKEEESSGIKINI